MDFEAEYNNRLKIAGFDAIIAGWAADAALFRDSHRQAELGVAYGPSGREALDLFWPAGSGKPKIAMFVHGGYWQALDRSFCSHLAAGLLAHRVAVAIPSYDLCPSISLDALVEQLRQAAMFLYRRHDTKLLVAGHSAGGHLAAMLLATDWTARGLPADMVSAALPISGLFDLVPLVETSINAGLRLDHAAARRLSPLFLPPPGRPLHAFVGGEEGEEYTRQSRSMAEAWTGRWESLEGENHLTIVAGLADPASPMIRAALDLLG